MTGADAMTGAGSMTGMHMGAASMSAMALMMLPSAAPAIARRARDGDSVVAAPLFAGSYVAVWALVATALWLLYRPPGAVVAGVMLVAAGLYELTPLKRACRIRCRQRVRSGWRFGVYCFGSSIGLMLVLVAVNVMSIALMVAIAVVVLAQKLLPPVPAIDVLLAFALVTLGVAVATT
jgi:predicted metal-binding membrane protein